MGSLEEDELVQMVHDFIESDHSPSATTLITSSNHHSLHNRTQYSILQDILRSDTTSAEAKIMKYVLKHMRGRHGFEKTRSLSRCLVKRMRKDGLNASLYQTSWSTSLGCPAGEYEYIEVIIEEENNIDDDPMRLIVDIDFKSQFELARPTEYYKELTDLLPVIFVGRENKLCKIISLLCSAAKQSLREKGLHVPPWRTTTYMQSKWLSECPKEPNPAGDGVGIGDNIIGNNNKVVSIMKPKKRDLNGESGLSSQLSNMSINCC